MLVSARTLTVVVVAHNDADRSDLQRTCGNR
jgi:hypothetical protein